MLCLPPRLGGFGLGGAELNKGLDVKKQLKSVTSMKHIVPDICWDSKRVVVEYDSDDFHIDTSETRRKKKARITSDSIKRRTYSAKKYSVVTVTNGEFIDFDEIEMIAVMLSKLLGKHGLRSSKKHAVDRIRLHEWLRVPADQRDPYR